MIVERLRLPSERIALGTSSAKVEKQSAHVAANARAVVLTCADANGMDANGRFFSISTS
jgi:hypothetical protein